MFGAKPHTGPAELCGNGRKVQPAQPTSPRSGSSCDARPSQTELRVNVRNSLLELSSIHSGTPLPRVLIGSPSLTALRMGPASPCPEACGVVMVKRCLFHTVPGP
ncbi:hypothetical protein KIL84_009918 [Mauremys mutica]|uniref:Uncharacterized protein n=1 Tax=Mauremys mutica TaxID=74926 RepID=A0A9D3XKA9_9SAUR|nr:hypothetical protein KIL84_009918 [Mauremys mutica]